MLTSVCLQIRQAPFRSERGRGRCLTLVSSSASTAPPVCSSRGSRETRQRGQAAIESIDMESAWSDRFGPRMSEEIRRRDREVAPGVQAIAWKARLRLHKRYTKLLARGKNKQRTITAVARELAGFIWAISRESKLLAS
jgi:hypothetical protein